MSKQRKIHIIITLDPNTELGEAYIDVHEDLVVEDFLHSWEDGGWDYTWVEEK
jgi:hypothetical protein